MHTNSFKISNLKYEESLNFNYFLFVLNPFLIRKEQKKYISKVDFLLSRNTKVKA